MELHSLIVHKLEKEFNGNPNLTLRPNVIPVGDRETEFVDNIREGYYKKTNRLYGVFDGNLAAYPFQTFLRGFCDGNHTFLEWSVSAMRHLEATVRDVPQATGGYVLFADYTHLNQRYAMTVVLNDQKAYNFTDELGVEEILSIAIDKLDVANAVNISKWDDGDERYLSFVKGRKDISDYFLRFIGCTTNIDAKRESQRFYLALRQFLDQQQIDGNQEERIRSDVYDYCHNQISRGEELSLTRISGIVNQEQPELFAEFAAGEEYGVSATFGGHKQTLKNLTYFTYTGRGLTIKFERGAWDDQVDFNADTNTLTIRNVPDALREQLMDIGH